MLIGAHELGSIALGYGEWRIVVGAGTASVSAAGAATVIRSAATVSPSVAGGAGLATCNYVASGDLGATAGFSAIFSRLARSRATSECRTRVTPSFVFAAKTVAAAEATMQDDGYVVHRGKGVRVDIDKDFSTHPQIVVSTDEI